MSTDDEPQNIATETMVFSLNARPSMTPTAVVSLVVDTAASQNPADLQTTTDPPSGGPENDVATQNKAANLLAHGFATHKKYVVDTASLTPEQLMHKSMSNPRGKQLWAKVRENISVLVPPKEAVRVRRPLTPPLMFDPDSDAKIKWDLALALCVVYTTCVVPVRISFSIEATGFASVFETVIDVLFFIDIMFNFRTGIVNPVTGQ
ncbi:hypothetical protein As57867_002507, partial [Aphanomyces stellatus]